jgi:hypothetical protein
MDEDFSKHFSFVVFVVYYKRGAKARDKRERMSSRDKNAPRQARWLCVESKQALKATRPIFEYAPKTAG